MQSVAKQADLVANLFRICDGFNPAATDAIRHFRGRINDWEWVKKKRLS